MNVIKDMLTYAVDNECKKGLFTFDKMLSITDIYWIIN